MSSSSMIINSEIDDENGEALDVYQTYELSDGKRSVTILASKVEENRINKDQVYATKRFLSAVGDGTATEEEEDFNHNATLLLIECVKDRFDRFRSCRQGRYAVYKEIQEEFRSYAYNLSIDKIRSKWNNLVTTYKRIKYRQKAGGLGKSAWNYFQALDKLLGPLYASSGPAGLSFLTHKPIDIKNESLEFPMMPVVIQNAQALGEATPSPIDGDAVLPSPSTSSVDDKRKYSESEECESKGAKRQELMEKYFDQIQEKEMKEDAYRRRKERRERLKLRALQTIGKELQAISQMQVEILKQQTLILENMRRPDD